MCCSHGEPVLKRRETGLPSKAVTTDSYSTYSGELVQLSPTGLAQSTGDLAHHKQEAASEPTATYSTADNERLC